MGKRAHIIASLVIGLVFCVSGCRAQPAEHQAVEAPTILAGGETLVGLGLEADIAAFLGVPYASAPIGDLRWRPAVPHAPREGRVDATAYGPACPQSQGNPDWYRIVAEGFGQDPALIPDLTHMDENCLYLNIWAPGRGKAKNLPVMIWVHGGSNINGWAYEPNYIGAELAARGVIVITINYRLGALGFLPIPLDDASDIPAGNYGLSDIIAATQWVRDNAESFGGDPANLTLFGESAGGANIFALMKSPQAEGLFQRAILESGALGPTDMPLLAQAKERARDMFNKAGIESTEAAKALPWQKLVDLHKQTGVEHYHGPVLDDYWVRTTGEMNAGVDVMAGSNLNEMLMYLEGSDAEILAFGLADYPADARKTILVLPVLETMTAREIVDALSTASQFHCPSVRIADAAALRGQQSYLYRFTRRREGADAYGAYHGAEIPYVFGTHDDWLPTHAQDQVLTSIMMAYWTNFARAGDPNGDGLPVWSRHMVNSSALQELGDQVRARTDFMAPMCDALKGETQ